MTTASIIIAFADLVAIALFIYGLHELNSPATARRGNRLAMIGMFIALVGVVASTEGVGWWAIAVGTAIGAIVGVYAALKVKMTAMPQIRVRKRVPMPLRQTTARNRRKYPAPSEKRRAT